MTPQNERGSNLNFFFIIYYTIFKTFLEQFIAPLSVSQYCLGQQISYSKIVV